MAETISARFGIRNWGAGSDTVSRDEFNTNFTVIETNGAMFAQGTVAARPASGKAGRFWEVVGDADANNNGLLYYDTGAAWITVGATLRGVTVTPTIAANKALVVKGLASQVGLLFEVQNSAAASQFSVDATGVVTAKSGTFSGTLTVTGTLTASGNLTVGGTLTGQAANFGGTLTATKTKSTSNRADGSPKWELNADGTTGGLFPVGIVVPYAGPTAPAGWLMCDGTSVLRADYPDLFNLIGSTYGAADGTHFNVPDLRERVVQGAYSAGDVLAASDGLAVAARAAAWSHTHTHVPTMTGSTLTGVSGGHAHTGQANGAGTIVAYGGTYGDSSHTHSTGTPSATVVVAATPNNQNVAGPGHGHTISGGAHDHSVSVYVNDPARSLAINSFGDHNHTVNVGVTIANATPARHPFLALNQIIKT